MHATRQQVRSEIFEDKEAIITTCEVQVRKGIDVSQVKEIRTKAPRLMRITAPAARSNTAKQDKEDPLATSNKVQPPPATRALAGIQGYAQPWPAPKIAPPGSGGQLGQHLQVLSPPAHNNSAVNKKDKTPRGLNEAARTTTSPPETWRTGIKGAYATEAPTPNTAGPAAVAAPAARPQDSGGMDERGTPGRSRRRKRQVRDKTRKCLVRGRRTRKQSEGGRSHRDQGT